MGRPAIISEYYTNGVDYADQLRTEYSTYRGFVVMKELPDNKRVPKNNRQKPRTMVEFHMNLAKLLIDDYKENERAAFATISNGVF